MKKSKTMAWLAAGVAVALVAAALPAAAQTPPRSVRVQFAKGAASATVKGTIKGREIVDYRVRAAAGQVLAVTLRESNPQNYFNILPPGSKDVAMFVGQDGSDFERMLPADGDYTIRVYLMRPAARRQETSRYTLTVAVTGAPLKPLPASKDAVLPGTNVHASTTVACTPPFPGEAQRCDARVIRRAFDGTATVEIRVPGPVPRRVLFVRGAPVSADATGALTHAREGDDTVLRIGDHERYVIPDALVRGG